MAPGMAGRHGYRQDEETEEMVGTRKKTRRFLACTGRVEWAKRTSRSRSSVNPARVLQGYGAWRYKLNLEWRKVKIRTKEASAYLELWGSSFKQIEGFYGSGVSSYFRFLRWVLILNITIFVLPFLFLVTPHLVFVTYATTTVNVVTSPNVTPSVMTSSQAVTTSVDKAEYCSSKYAITEDESVIQLMLDFIQGTGWMEKTLLFYGEYVQQTISMVIWSTSTYTYNMPLAYLLVTFFYLLISLYLIINHTNLRLRDRLKDPFVGGRPAHRCYSNIVFASWDFSLCNGESAQIRQTTIFNEIRSNLEEKRLLSRKLARTSGEKWCLYLLRFLLNVFVLGTLGVAALIIYFATVKSTEFKDRPNYEQQHKLVQLWMEFLPSLVITSLNIFIPLIFTLIANAEDYHPDFEIRITLARTVFLRLASVAVLLMTLYYQISCKAKDECHVGEPPECPQLRCWETYVGQNIYKLVIMNIVVNIAVVVFVETPVRIFGRRFPVKFVRNKVEKLEFNIPKNVLDLVYVQTLCWLGTFFAPLLPVMTVLTLFLLFYLKKVTVLYNYNPSERPFRSSRSQIFFMLILLIAFFLCCVPIIYCIWKIQPSRGCGPFRDVGHMYDVLVISIATWPKPLPYIINFLLSPACVIAIVIFLGVLLYFYRADSKFNKGMASVLKEQLKHESRDKQFLLQRLNEVTGSKTDTSASTMDEPGAAEGVENEAANIRSAENGPPNYNTFTAGPTSAPLATPDNEIP